MSAAVLDQSTDSTAKVLDHAAAEGHRPVPRLPVEEQHAPVVRKADPVDTLTALDAALSAAQASPGNTHQTPAAKIDSPRLASAEPPVFDDLPWLDDVPPQPLVASETIDDTAADIATLDWDTLAARVSVCERCRLCERRTNSVFGVGDRNADWMLIGEAPGENEDKLGEPFVGQAGKLLDSMLHAVALSR